MMGMSKNFAKSAFVLKFKDLDKKYFKKWLIYNYNYEKARIEDEYNELVMQDFKNDEDALLDRVRNLTNIRTKELFKSIAFNDE